MIARTSQIGLEIFSKFHSYLSPQNSIQCISLLKTLNPIPRYEALILLAYYRVLFEKEG